MRRLAFRLLLTGAAAGTAYYYCRDRTWSSLRIVRFGRATYAAFRVTTDYKWTLRNVDPNSPNYGILLSEVHLRSALRLREMCSLNGGLFIKVGQHIGSLEYLLPLEYVRTFKLFHSEAPKSSLSELKQVIREEFKRPADEVFARLEEEPLGAASLAQCHKGVLKDGRIVAVKIQRPDVRENSSVDMDTIDFLVWCVKKAFPTFQFGWLAKEVRRNLPVELDFHNEARNQEKFAAMFKHLHFAKSPTVHWDLTTARVLTMDFEEGGKVDNLKYITDNKISVNEVSLKLSQLFSEMIFIHGFIHCDPHPGNVLARKDKNGSVEIVLLDHGLYTELSDKFRVTYCRLWQALIKGDTAGIKEYCLKLNAGELYPLLASVITARAWNSIQTGIAKKERTAGELKEIRRHAVMYFGEISQLLNSVPRELLLILKTNDLLRSLEFVLAPRVHTQSFITMSKYCVRALGDQDARDCTFWWQRMVVRTRTSLSLLFIRLYETWLWCKGALLE
eukprot:Em0019g142a